MSDSDLQAITELQLWPEIKAMLATELSILTQRFPSFQDTTQISKSLMHICQDLVKKALNDPTLSISAGRLEEITQIFAVHQL